MSISSVHTEEEYKGYTIQIAYDNDCPESPRDWDNLGTMACWHDRMWLGDNAEEIQKYEPVEWMRRELYDYKNKIEKNPIFKEWKNEHPLDSGSEDEDEFCLEDFIEYASDEYIHKMFSEFYVTLPIYAYEHGGITIRSGSFSDPWDSGQLGFIYCSKEKALKEFTQKKWSKKLEKKILQILDGEIETYDQYLQGDVHGYLVYGLGDEDLDDPIDSCWGFYGSEYVMEEAKSIVDWHVKNEKKQAKLFNACMSL